MLVTHIVLTWIGLDDFDDSIYRLLQGFPAIASVLNSEYAA